MTCASLFFFVLFFASFCVAHSDCPAYSLCEKHSDCPDKFVCVQKTTGCHSSFCEFDDHCNTIFGTCTEDCVDPDKEVGFCSALICRPWGCDGSECVNLTDAGPIALGCPDDAVEDKCYEFSKCRKNADRTGCEWVHTDQFSICKSGGGGTNGKAGKEGKGGKGKKVGKGGKGKKVGKGGKGKKKGGKPMNA